jgi:hypothetical protein
MTDYVPMTDSERANAESVLAALVDIDEKVDGWTSKSDNRPTGVSFHAKFGRKTDVMTAIQFSNIIDQAPGLLSAYIRKLLAADQAAQRVPS